MFPLVHWHEGLFLRPHHLQLLQRGFQLQVASERQLAWAYPYGVVEAALSPDELNNSLIRFDRLRVVLRNGLEIRVPGNAELPPLDIKPEFAKGAQSLNVYLAVPHWVENQANAFQPGEEPDYRKKYLYRLREMECADENTGRNPQPVQCRTFNVRLLLEHEDRTGLEVFPVLHVRRSGDDRPEPDPEFVPPCLVLAGSPTLRDVVRNLVAQVEATRQTLEVQVQRGGVGLEAKFDKTLRLRTLNHFSARLSSLLPVPFLPPFVVYLELRSLLGELAALQPSRGSFQAASYDHESCLHCFRDLDQKIRRELIVGPEGQFWSVSFSGRPGLLRAALTDEQLTRPVDYFLGIQTRLPRAALATHLTDSDQFKLLPASLEEAAVWGVPLLEEQAPPLTLPARANLHYFRLARKEKQDLRWEQIKDEKKVSLVWENTLFDLSEATFALYMTLPEGT